MKAFIYCRTTDRNPTAIKAQKVACANYCRLEGLAVEKLFLDIDVAAFAEGPGLGGLIRACRATSCDVRHLVLYPSADTSWVIRKLAEALKSPEVDR